MTDAQKERFESLACQLSPENLACDGEASEEEIDRRFRQIQEEWTQLEKECGQKVTENNVWNWVYSTL